MRDYARQRPGPLLCRERGLPPPPELVRPMITRGGVTSLPRLVTPDERHTDTRFCAACGSLLPNIGDRHSSRLAPVLYILRTQLRAPPARHRRAMPVCGVAITVIIWYELLYGTRRKQVPAASQCCSLQVQHWSRVTLEFNRLQSGMMSLSCERGVARRGVA